VLTLEALEKQQQSPNNKLNAKQLFKLGMRFIQKYNLELGRWVGVGVGMGVGVGVCVCVCVFVCMCVVCVCVCVCVEERSRYNCPC